MEGKQLERLRGEDNIEDGGRQYRRWGKTIQKMGEDNIEGGGDNMKGRGEYEGGDYEKGGKISEQFRDAASQNLKKNLI